MREFRLRWSPKNDFLILPGDTILESRPKAFHLSGSKLIDPELFRQASIEHDWPALPFVQWRKKVILAICECEYNDRSLTVPQQLEARITVNNLLDARITLEACLNKLQHLAS